MQYPTPKRLISIGSPKSISSKNSIHITHLKPNRNRQIDKASHLQLTRYPAKFKTLRKMKKTPQKRSTTRQIERNLTCCEMQQKNVGFKGSDEEEVSRVLDYLIESEREAASWGKGGQDQLPEGYQRCSLWIQIRQSQFNEQYPLEAQLPRNQPEVAIFQDNLLKIDISGNKEMVCEGQQKVEEKSIGFVNQGIDCDISVEEGKYWEPQPQQSINASIYRDPQFYDVAYESQEESPFDSNGCYKPCRRERNDNHNEFIATCLNSNSKQKGSVRQYSPVSLINSEDPYVVNMLQEGLDNIGLTMDKDEAAKLVDQIIINIQEEEKYNHQKPENYDIPPPIYSQIQSQPPHSQFINIQNCPIAELPILTELKSMQLPPQISLPLQNHPHSSCANNHQNYQPIINTLTHEQHQMSYPQYIAQASQQEQEQKPLIMELKHSPKCHSKCSPRKNLLASIKAGQLMVQNQQEDQIEEIPEDDYVKSCRISSILAPKSRLISKRSDYHTKEMTLINKRKQPQSSLLIYKPKSPGIAYEQVRRNIDESTITWSMMAKGWVPRLVKVLDVLEVDEVRYVYGLFWGEREQLMERFVMMPHFLDFYGSELQRYEISGSKQKTITVAIAESFE